MRATAESTMFRIIKLVSELELNTSYIHVRVIICNYTEIIHGHAWKFRHGVNRKRDNKHTFISGESQDIR